MTRLAAAALAAVALAGCGSAKDARRGDVNDYVASVNRVEQDALAPWKRAGNAYTAFSRGTIGARELRELDAAPRTIRSLRARIAAVTPPKDGKRLRASLLRMLDLDARFADEVDVFARYLHDVGPADQELSADTAQLRRSLGAAHTSAPEQRALARYAAQLKALLARFRSLNPPPALAPWHAEHAARIVTLRRGALELRSGLRRQDSALTNRGLAALTSAATTSPVTAADRTAVLAYNARLTQIRAAAAAVAREQNRLAREFT